jgi:protein ImuB
MKDEERVLAHRPLRLFPRAIPIQVVALVPLGTPKRFQHAGAERAVVRCQGPERIETGWWRCADIRRDYYIVETTEGARWWIFQRVDDGRWFLHGCFD